MKLGSKHKHCAVATRQQAREFRILGPGGTGSAPATCGVVGQGGQSLAAALHFSERQLVVFKPVCVLGWLRQSARTAVTTAVNGRKVNRRSPQKMRLKRGRWDRNRTCNLRFLPTHRPGSSKNVQPVCSQFCSQRDLHPNARRK